MCSSLSSCVCSRQIIFVKGLTSNIDRSRQETDMPTNCDQGARISNCIIILGSEAFFFPWPERERDRLTHMCQFLLENNNSCLLMLELSGCCSRCLTIFSWAIKITFVRAQMLREREKHSTSFTETWEMFQSITGRFDIKVKVILSEIQSLTRALGDVVSVRYDYMTIKEKKRTRFDSLLGKVHLSFFLFSPLSK